MTLHALITGASSGIGKALAGEFAADGYDLTLVSKDEARLERATGELARAFTARSIDVFAIDLTTPQAPEQLFAEMTRRGRPVDVLVNDAGIGQQGPFLDAPLERYRELIRLNIEALTFLTKLFLPPMVERGRGGVLNVGSVAGFQPGPLLGVYHATKAYVVSFTEALAEELKDSGVTITCLCPGPTATSFFERSEMTDSRVVQHRSMLMEPEAVAKAGYKAFKSGQRVFIPGGSNKALTFMRRVIPQTLQAKIHKKLYEPVREERRM